MIPGCKSVEQVESNASSAGLELVRDDHPQAGNEVIPTHSDTQSWIAHRLAMLYDMSHRQAREPVT